MVSREAITIQAWSCHEIEKPFPWIPWISLALVASGLLMALDSYPLLSVQNSSIISISRSRQAHEPTQDSRWAKKSEAGTKAISLSSGMLRIFPLPSPTRGVIWQRSTLLTSRLLSPMATAFPARDGVFPYPAPNGIKTSGHFWRCVRHFCPSCQA